MDMCGSNPIPERKTSEIALRCLLEGVCRLFPDAVQYNCFALLKRMRNAFAANGFDRLYASWDHLDAGDSARQVERGGDTPHPAPTSGADLSPKGRGAAGEGEHSHHMRRPSSGCGTFSVTHDVDYVDCYRYVPTLLDIDAALGVRATYNVLTNARYTLEDRVLFAILDKGNEVGLHGKNHDRALGFRSVEYIRDFIGSARRELDKRVGRIQGFRAPALAVTRNVIKSLEEHEFRYDSSLTNCGLYSSFTPHSAPFQIGDKGLMEIPLTIQDSMFINDIPLPREQIDQIIARLIELTLKNNSTLVLNSHPIIISSNPEYYTNIVRTLTRSPLKQFLMKDLI